LLEEVVKIFNCFDSFENYKKKKWCAVHRFSLFFIVALRYKKDIPQKYSNTIGICNTLIIPIEQIKQFPQHLRSQAFNSFGQTVKNQKIKFNRYVYMLSRTIYICMGANHSGSKRFVTASYFFMKVNGESTLEEILDYLKNDEKRNLQIKKTKAAALFSIHPMFKITGYEQTHGNIHKYKVALYDIIDEETIVNDLVDKLNRKVTLRYSLKKYPAFIIKQVNSKLEEQR